MCAAEIDSIVKHAVVEPGFIRDSLAADIYAFRKVRSLNSYPVGQILIFARKKFLHESSAKCSVVQVGYFPRGQAAEHKFLRWPKLCVSLLFCASGSGRIREDRRRKNKHRRKQPR